MVQIAGLQDFRKDGPIDITTFQMPCSALVFHNTFSGTDYYVALRSGARGWVLVSFGTVLVTAINTAIVYVGGLGGGTVHLSLKGTYTVTATIVDGGQDNIVLEGEGWATHLRLADNTQLSVIHVEAQTGWLVRDLQVDGNKANNIQVPGGTPADMNQCGIVFLGCTDSKAVNCYVHDAVMHGINLHHACLDCAVLFCRTDENGEAGDYVNQAGILVFHGCLHVTVIGNHCKGNYNKGIYTSEHVEHMTVADNTINATSGFGIYVLWVSHCAYVGNTILLNVGGPGILVNGTFGICEEITIVGNTIKHIVGTIASGVEFNGAGANIVTNVVLAANTILITVAACIGINISNLTNSIIQGNIIKAGNNTSYGIYLVISSDNILEGNLIQGWATNSINISAATSVRNRFINTKIVNCGPVNDLGTDTIWPTLILPFVDGTATVVVDAAPKGWSVTLATNFALALGVMPLECQQSIRMKVHAISLVAEADGMRLQVTADACQPTEAWNAEDVDVTKTSGTLNFAANAGIVWTLTPADDVDVDGLVAGDQIEIKAIYAPISGANIATNALLRCVEIQYV